MKAKTKQQTYFVRIFSDFWDAIGIILGAKKVIKNRVNFRLRFGMQNASKMMMFFVSVLGLGGV